MPGVSRKGVDVAGGVGIEGSPNTYANGKSVMRNGDKVQPHDNGVHASSPSMIAGADRVYCNGKLVVRAGDSATCGHVINGSSNVLAG